MNYSNKHVSIFSAITFLVLTASSAAQSTSASASRVKAYGNSNGGVDVRPSANITAKRSTFGKFYRGERFDATARGTASADLRFLGSRKSAGDFRINLAATGDVRRRFNGSYLGSSCASSGSIYLRIANTVIWNSSFSSALYAPIDYRIRIMTPSLVVPMPMGVLLLNARAYGRVRGSVIASFNACAGRVGLSGNMAISGDANASVTVLSLLVAAKVTAIFYVTEQRLELRNLRAGVAYGSGSTWGRSGSVFFHSGPMQAFLKLSAIVPPAFRVSKTLLNWVLGASTSRML